jgi:nitrogen fixation protein NifU and related proteins
MDMGLDNNNRSVNRGMIPNRPVGTGGGQPYLQNWLGPYNEGQLPEANGIGKITGPCGDTMMMYLRIGKESIDDVRFQVDGCAFSRTCASIAASLAKGKNLEEAWDIDEHQILRCLSAIPPEEKHCAVLARDTLRRAIEYFLKSSPQAKGSAG